MDLELSAEHIVGLVVGEGCFYAESTPDTKYRLGWRLRPAFSIEMRIDERPVLEAVRQTLGCGRVYELDFGRYRGYEKRNWMGHAKYRVGATRDLARFVVPFFEANPLFGRKAMAFKHFSQLVRLLSSGSHRSPEGLREGKALATLLTDHNRRGRQGKS